MNCKKAETLLVEYLYQELSAARTVEIEKHLETCDRCAKTMESWRAIHGGFRNSDYPETTPYLKQKILNAAKQELSRKPSFAERLSFLVKPAFVLPVMLVALLALLYIPFKTTNKSEVAMASKVKNSPAVLQSSDDRSRKQELDKLRNLADSGGKEEENQEQRQNATRSKSQNSISSDSVVKEEQATKSRELQKEAYQAEAERADQASQFNEKKSIAAASPPPELQPAPASEPQPQQKEGIQTDDEKRVAGLVAYKSKDATKNDVAFERAQVLFKNNELSQGKIYAQQAIDQDKSRSLASQFHQAGIEYQQEHENDKAIVQFSLLVKNYPDYPQRADVLLRLGDSYRELGQYEEAQKTYEQLLALQPSNKTAAERLMLLTKRKQAEDQLRSLGYVEQPHR
jgi:tetratricopeptide (TPR) repeat protein